MQKVFQALSLIFSILIEEGLALVLVLLNLLNKLRKMRSNVKLYKLNNTGA